MFSWSRSMVTVGGLLVSERKGEIRDRAARTRRLYTDTGLGKGRQEVDISADVSGDIKPKNTCGSSTGGRPSPLGNFKILETPSSPK